jgi:hypothetical protein
MGECQTEICSHVSCNREQRIWLVKAIQNHNFRKTSSTGISDVALHPYCVFCGIVKNISDDPSKKIGYWINILSKITREYNISQIQKRLVIQELEKNDSFVDLYSVTGTAQREFFVKTVKKYCSLSEQIIDSFVF